ncbi:MULTISPECIES: DUF551 domain-containing protein [unclassified Moraxella]|uniref:DUF551 domain-containing protein n=1 Tax=unclassified Moraxella TaxID=2685852 RepID=UPI002B40D94D|nr:MULTISPECIES: DUF551 domain-containing protein [unclassified Moraxella]
MNKFLKIIKKRLDNYKNSNNNCPKINEVIFELDELVNIAETQISQSNNGWISVDDELPKPFEKVLVYVKTPKKVIIGTDSHNPELLEYGVRHSFVLTEYEVTHWQPLPQPPKILK